MKWSRLIFLTASICGIEVFLLGSVFAQDTAAIPTRKEWRAHVERVQQRVEKIRQEGKFLEGEDLQSVNPKSSEASREEWRAQVELARQRVEKIRREKELVEQQEATLGQPAGENVERIPDQNALTAIDSGPTAPEHTGNLIATPSKSNGVKIATRSHADGGNPVNEGNNQRAEVQRAKQRDLRNVRHREALDRSPSVTAAMATTPGSSSPSCSSFWTCLKKLLIVR